MSAQIDFKLAKRNNILLYKAKLIINNNILLTKDFFKDSFDQAVKFNIGLNLITKNTLKENVIFLRFLIAQIIEDYAEKLIFNKTSKPNFFNTEIVFQNGQKIFIQNIFLTPEEQLSFILKNQQSTSYSLKETKKMIAESEKDIDFQQGLIKSYQDILNKISDIIISNNLIILN